MRKTKIACELCMQPVLVAGFELNTESGEKKFCCEGCKSIYQLLNPPQSSKTIKSTKEIIE